MAVWAVGVANCPLPCIRAGKDGDFATTIIVKPFDPPAAGEFPILKNPCRFRIGRGRHTAGPADLDDLVLDLAMIPAQKTRDLLYREAAQAAAAPPPRVAC